MTGLVVVVVVTVIGFVVVTVTVVVVVVVTVTSFVVVLFVSKHREVRQRQMVYRCFWYVLDQFVLVEPGTRGQ